MRLASFSRLKSDGTTGLHQPQIGRLLSPPPVDAGDVSSRVVGVQLDKILEAVQSL